jgi:methyl-accepting chemotaxis protein
MRKFRFNLEMMVKNFYFFTVFALIIGGTTYIAVRDIGKEIDTLQGNHLPVLSSAYEMQLSLDQVAVDAEKHLNAATAEEKTAVIEAINRKGGEFKNSLARAMNDLSGEEAVASLKELEKRSQDLLKLFEGTEVNRDEVEAKLSRVRASLENFREHSLKKMDEKFKASKTSLGRALFIVVILTLMAIVGMVILGLILSRAVGTPVSKETERLIKNSKDVEKVFGEISSGTKRQTDVVQVATKELEDLIINIIQGSISLSVDKQAEIAKTFAEFLRHFVERTSVEIAMGMMSVSQQSKEARKGIEDFIREVATVEGNIRAQEEAIEEMVNALRSIVDANKEIKEKVHGSTEAADMATLKAFSGQERIGMISEQLQGVRISSEGVREIMDSLAKITEGIKILALNMSLKVEDIKDDTGKTYGFEAMSEKVQKLAEEVEGLLERSKDMIIPTIQGIERVSLEANNARGLIDDVVRSIKTADDQSKAIAAQINKQASDIDRVEVEAENLRALAHKTTLAVEAQGALARDVDGLLKDSETLIESVNLQTQEASEGARKVNQIMGQLRQTVTSIEEGTGKLTEKSSQISDMFEAIRDLAVKNMSGAERLEGVTASIVEVSNRLSRVVKGEGI